MYNRFFEKPSVIGGKFALSAENADHAAKVLRLRRGERVVVCDGDCNDYLCDVDDVSKSGVMVNVVEKARNRAEPEVPLTIFQALVKGEKFDFIIQKCVELGVRTIVPFESERCVVRAERSAAKTARWQKIAEGAAKQSGRGIIPEIGEILPIGAAAELARKSGLRSCVAYENADSSATLKKWLNGAVFGENDFGAFVGPEGGFADAEINLFTKNDIQPVTLGRRILRAETATLALAACFFHDMEGN